MAKIKKDSKSIDKFKLRERCEDLEIKNEQMRYEVVRMKKYCNSLLQKNYMLQQKDRKNINLLVQARELLTGIFRAIE